MSLPWQHILKDVFLQKFDMWFSEPSLKKKIQKSFQMAAIYVDLESTGGLILKSKPSRWFFRESCRCSSRIGTDSDQT